MNNPSDTLLYRDAFPDRALALAGDSVAKGRHKEVKSLFSGSEHLVKGFEIHHRESDSGFQPFWLLAASLLVLIFLKFIYSERLNILIINFVNLKAGRQQGKAEGNKALPALLMYLVFFVNFSLFVLAFEGAANGTFHTSKLFAFWPLFFAIFLYTLFKITMTYISGIVFFDIDAIAPMLQLNTACVLNCILVLLPANFLFIYTFNLPEFGYIVLIIIALLFFLKLTNLYFRLRALSSLLGYQIILYLCTLEILPLIVLVKYAVSAYLQA